MNTLYEFADGSVKEIHVPDQFSKELSALEKEQSGKNQNKIKRNQSLDILLKTEFVQLPDHSVNIEEEVLKKLERQQLYKAVEKLPPPQQRMIFLIYIKNISMAEIARREHISRAAMTGRMKRIYKLLRKYLNEIS